MWNFKNGHTSIHSVNIRRNNYQVNDFPPNPTRSLLFCNPSKTVFFIVCHFFWSDPKRESFRKLKMTSFHRNYVRRCFGYSAKPPGGFTQQTATKRTCVQCLYLLPIVLANQFSLCDQATAEVSNLGQRLSSWEV